MKKFKKYRFYKDPNSETVYKYFGLFNNGERYYIFKHGIYEFHYLWRECSCFIEV